MRATTAPMRQVISRVLRIELTLGGQLGQVGINAVQWWRVLGANRRKHAVPLWDKSCESIPLEGSWGAGLASLVCGCPEC